MEEEKKDGYCHRSSILLTENLREGWKDGNFIANNVKSGGEDMGKHENKRRGYANYKRQELLHKLKPVLGKLVNISTGIEANLSKKSLDKMSSAKTLEKSKANGFTLDEHFELAAKIKPLYETAILVAEHGNLRNPNDPNVVSMKQSGRVDNCKRKHCQWAQNIFNRA